MIKQPSTMPDGSCNHHIADAAHTPLCVLGLIRGDYYFFQGPNKVGEVLAKYDYANKYCPRCGSLIDWKDIRKLCAEGKI